MAILSYVHEIQTVYNVVQNPQMILLSEKGAHGVSSSFDCLARHMLTNDHSHYMVLLGTSSSSSSCAKSQNT